MSKKKKPNIKNYHPNRNFTTPSDLRHQGLKAFESGHYDAAIAHWSTLVQSDPKVKAALAEAYFRRALNTAFFENTIPDLQRALELAPQEWRFHYHLGLNLQRSGKLSEAIAVYRCLLEHQPNWAGAGLVLGLANLAQNPDVDLSSLLGSTPATVEALSPVQALLHKTEVAAPSLTAGPMARLWYGLSLLQAGKAAEALEWLEPKQVVPGRAIELRLYYQGLAAFQSGDPAGALKLWLKVFENNRHLPWLRQNLAALLLEQLKSERSAENTAEMVPFDSLLGLVKVNAALAEKILETFDRQAYAAAEKGQWEAAALLWGQMRQIMGVVGPKAGSPRAILHNLALAYEAQDKWGEAAEGWRAMLRTRPRQAATATTTLTPKSSLETSGYSEAQWRWVRRRVIECYKQAGQPEEAVTVFRAAIKAEPDDFDLRLQLVDALVANDQVQAAFNELGRIIQLNPTNVEAELKLAELESEVGMWGAAPARLRRLAEKYPDRADVRTQLVQTLLKFGTELHDNGMVAEATEFLKEARQLDPTNFRLSLTLARIAIDQAHPKEAQALLEETLRLAQGQAEAYIMVFDCWIALDKLDEAQKVVTQAQTVLPSDPTWYIQMAANILRRKSRNTETSLNPLAQIFGRLAPPSPPKANKAAKPEENPWEQAAVDLLNKATALKPGDANTQNLAAATALMFRPDLALPYAREAVRLAPDDMRQQMTLGLVLGMNDQVREAKEVLGKAAKRARQQGDNALADRLEEMRREVDSPLFKMLPQLGPFVGLLDDYDDEDDGDDDFDFFG